MFFATLYPEVGFPLLVQHQALLSLEPPSSFPNKGYQGNLYVLA
jgi:hypothetical protein